MKTDIENTYGFGLAKGFFQTVDPIGHFLKKKHPDYFMAGGLFNNSVSMRRECVTDGVDPRSKKFGVGYVLGLVGGSAFQIASYGGTQLFFGLIDVLLTENRLFLSKKDVSYSSNESVNSVGVNSDSNSFVKQTLKIAKDLRNKIATQITYLDNNLSDYNNKK